MKGFVKDPDSTLDYSFDWALWLDGDTIASSTWVIDSPLTIVPASQSFTDTITLVFISGGVDKIDYELRNTIVTAGSRTDERTMEIRVRQR